MAWRGDVSPDGHGRCLWVTEEIHDDDRCVPATEGSSYCDFSNGFGLPLLCECGCD